MYKLRYSVVLVTLVAAMIALSGRSMRAAEGQDATAENERQLIAVLESDAPPADKAITCKRLAIYGTKEAVPALAGLLPNRELASWARIALEAIPDPAADEALRAAVEKVEGRLRVGVINSIGVRRDAQAVGILVPQLQQADADVASAAAVALGHIGDPASAESLEQALAAVPDAVRAAVAEGLVYCAEKCLADENFAEATRIYDLVRAAEVPKPRMLEATRGAILARRSDGIPLLIEQLESADRALFGLGLFTAREMTGTDVTKALVAEMGKMTPERQGLVITALADRGDTAALPALLQAVKDGPPQVRMAALGALPQLGDDSCIETLLGISTEGDAGLAQALKTALQGLKGEEVDVELTSRLAKAEGDAAPRVDRGSGRAAHCGRCSRATQVGQRFRCADSLGGPDGSRFHHRAGPTLGPHFAGHQAAQARRCRGCRASAAHGLRPHARSRRLCRGACGRDAGSFEFREVHICGNPRSHGWTQGSRCTGGGRQRSEPGTAGCVHAPAGRMDDCGCSTGAAGLV